MTGDPKRVTCHQQPQVAPAASGTITQPCQDYWSRIAHGWLPEKHCLGSTRRFHTYIYLDIYIYTYIHRKGHLNWDRRTPGGGVLFGLTQIHLDSLGPLGRTWTHLDSFGVNWTHLVGLTWAHLDLLGFACSHGFQLISIGFIWLQWV